MWDWNVSTTDGGRIGPGAGNPPGWDGISSAQYASLTRATAGLVTLTPANLQTAGGTSIIRQRPQHPQHGHRVNASICWTGACTSGTSRASIGWYLNLPGTEEQIIYSPELVQQAITVNSIVPAANCPTSCAITMIRASPTCCRR